METRKLKEWSIDWIISVTDPKNAIVHMFRLYGTEQETAKKLVAMAIEDGVYESDPTTDYLFDVDDSEIHKLQLVAYKDGDRDTAPFIYNATQFSALDFIRD